MNEAEEKMKFRLSLLEKRQNLNLEEISKYSQNIAEKLIETISWKDVKKFHIYKPVKSKKEISTDNIIKWLENNHPEIEILFAPTKTPFEMPRDQSYDVVILPVLGFDRSGNRIGYGGGYYDKFLGQNRCKKIIGLAYSFCELYELPTESHDKKLEMVVTEKEVINLSA